MGGHQRMLRLDCVIAFDRIPDVGNPAFPGNLRPCRCVAGAVEQFGTTAKMRLSDHFGVSVRWSCRHRPRPAPHGLGLLSRGHARLSGVLGDDRGN